jgi:hypothetical protein
MIWFSRLALQEQERPIPGLHGYQGFKEKQVKRIILTRPAVEAGKSWFSWRYERKTRSLYAAAV